MEHDLITRDLATIWHPCAQMKDYETFKPLTIVSAKESYVELGDGRRLIDAFSSWWCKSLGHGHPRLRQALIEQANQFEHVSLTHTTYEKIVALSEKLTALTPHLNKVSYASDGSCAVEMAMKMSLHLRQVTGESERSEFVALSGSYHGETCAALAASDLGIYSEPYRPMLPPVHFLQPIPYVSGQSDPLWQDCGEQWKIIELQLEERASRVTAILVEPIVQAANAMSIYSQDLLRKLRKWTRENNVHLIVDEVFTGLGRTGLPLACQYADIEPDFLCLGKGLTAGWLPLSAMLTSDDVYNLFYDDYKKGKNFLHSHTFTGNALAVSVALECLSVMDDEAIYSKVRALEPNLRVAMQEIAAATGKLHNIRGIGAVIAADLIVEDPTQRLGFEIYQKAAALGALMRPLGNTIYWVPPLNIELNTLSELKEITQQSILSAKF